MERAIATSIPLVAILAISTAAIAKTLGVCYIEVATLTAPAAAIQHWQW
ncbi:MAG: hypothetical protein F6K31_21255, partial [Symploca sp. SIO2G7]|nr:hypothetical protein [Symploca sp. SIO2G7]